jgi:hypothetical protein
MCSDILMPGTAVSISRNSPGLQVPDVDGRGTAAHPQDDDALVLAAELLGACLDIAHELQAGQRQRGKSRDVREEMTPVHPGGIGHGIHLFVVFVG